MKQHKVISGIFYNSMYQVLLIIVPLFTSPYLSRTLGAEKIGLFQYSYSIAYYLFLIAMLGVNNYGNREVARVRNDYLKRSQIFWQIFYMQFFMGIIFSVGYFIFVMQNIDENKVIFLIQTLTIISACFDTNWFAFAMEKFKATTIRSTIIKVISTIAIFVLVHNETDIWKYTLIMTSSNIIGFIIIWPIIIKNTKFQFPHVKQIKSHILSNIILFLPSIASSMYQYMDKIMLGGLKGLAEVGYYNYAENIVTIPMSLMTAICTVMLPYISNMIAEGQMEKTKKILLKSLKYTSIINVGFMFGMIAVSHIFIPWYLGNDFIYTAKLVNILAINIVICGYLNIVRSQWLIPNRFDKVYTISIVIGALFNVVLNLFLIPLSGAAGASISTVLAYVVVFIIQGWYIRKVVNIWKILVDFLSLIIIGLVMLFGINSINVFLPNITWLILLVDVVIGCLLYVFSLSIYFFILNKDEELIREIKKYLR